MIKWSESLSLDIQEIDDQHKKFMEIMNDLLSAVKSGKSKEVQSEIIDQLIGYAFYHFSKEERYFETSNYPYKDEHKKEHESFVDKVIEFKKDYEANKITLSIDMINFMNDWWVNHIRTTDKKLQPYINEQNKAVN